MNRRSTVIQRSWTQISGAMSWILALRTESRMVLLVGVCMPYSTVNFVPSRMAITSARMWQGLRRGFAAVPGG